MSCSVRRHPTPTMTPVVRIKTTHSLVARNFPVRPLQNNGLTIRCLTSSFPTRLPHQLFRERRSRIPRRWHPTCCRPDRPVHHPHRLRIHLGSPLVLIRLRCRLPQPVRRAVHPRPAAHQAGQRRKSLRLRARLPTLSIRPTAVDQPIPGRRLAPVNLKDPDDPNLPAVRSPREHRQSPVHLRMPDHHPMVPRHPRPDRRPTVSHLGGKVDHRRDRTQALSLRRPSLERDLSSPAQVRLPPVTRRRRTLYPGPPRAPGHSPETRVDRWTAARQRRGR